jgi:hypothetical protein
MLDTFLSGVNQAGVTNYLVVALDQETAADLTGRGLNAFYMPIQVREVEGGIAWRGVLGGRYYLEGSTLVCV